MALKPRVREELNVHGIDPRPGETADLLRERLNEVYVEEVRALRQRQRAGEIPLHDYARHVEALRVRFPLLALPMSMWEE